MFKKIVCLLLAVITVMGAFSGCGQENAKEINLKEINFSNEEVSQIKKSIDKILHNENFTGTAYANINNQELYFKSFGYSGPAKKDKIENNHTYQLGSVTKIFTGLAVMQLEADKKIKLTDNLSKYFKGYKYLDKITIKDLLEMKAGFGSYLENITKDKKFYKKIQKMVKKNPNNYKITYKITDHILKTGLKYDVGDYHFSDTCYFLLGRIVSRFSKKGFFGYLNKNIIKPLNLKQVKQFNPNQIIGGYNEKTKKWLLSSDIPFLNDYYVMYSSMGIISSAEDLNTVVNTIVSSKNINKILDTDSKFNYGFHIEENIIYAEGSTTLHSAYVYFDTERLIKSIVLSNHTNINNFDIIGVSISNEINSKINGILLDTAQS